MADFLPVMLKTTHMPCLVVGGGKVAFRKTLALLRFGVEITVVAEALTAGLQKLLDRRLIRWRPKKFSPIDLLFKKMVIAATNDAAVNRKITWWAKKMKLHYNTVDNMELSSFIFPAVYRSGALTVAISTQGYYPALARQLKRKLALYYGANYGKYLEKLRGYREQIKTIEPNPQQRRTILKKLLRVGVGAMIIWSEADFGVWLDRERKS